MIALDRDHHVGAATNKKVFPFVVGTMDGETVLFAAVNEGGYMSVICPDEAWIQAYQGD